MSQTVPTSDLLLREESDPASEANEAQSRRIESWIDELTTSLGTPRPHGSPLHLALQAKIRDCWSYHWQQAVNRDPAADWHAVAQSIRLGQGYLGQGQLDGDVIAEVILATLAVHRDEKAIARLRHLYRDEIARRLKTLVKAADPHWWGDFEALLLGFAERKDGTGSREAKLATYRGQSGLIRWLTLCARQFLGDEAKRATRRKAEELQPLATLKGGAAEPLITEECLTLLTADLSAALKEIAPQPRALLTMVVCEQVKQNQAAKIFNVNAGTISRWLESAHQTLRERLRWDNPARAQAQVRDCLEAIAQNQAQPSLAAALGELLTRAREVTS